MAANYMMERMEKQVKGNLGGNAKEVGVDLEYLKFAKF